MTIRPLSELRTFLEKYAEPMGIEIIDIKYTEKDRSITIFIDTEEGVDLNTCEAFHNAIMDPIDEFDPTFNMPYTLNVSSPTSTDLFTTVRDFERGMGKEVEVRLYAPIKGKKLIEGVLTAFDENSVTIRTQKEELKIARNRIAKINKAIKFD